MSKYAPGPWEVWTDKANDGTPYIRVYQRTPDDEHITICTMGISDGEAWGGYVGEEEDARLIAAAPDLLAACEAAKAQLDISRPYDPKRRLIEVLPAWGMLCAAIAKAKGEKP